MLYDVINVYFSKYFIENIFINYSNEIDLKNTFIAKFMKYFRVKNII